jgi:hypothetical protein
MVTLLWVRRGGMLPVGSVKANKYCDGLDRFKAIINYAVARGPADFLVLKYILYANSYVPLSA